MKKKTAEASPARFSPVAVIQPPPPEVEAKNLSAIPFERKPQYIPRAGQTVCIEAYVALFLSILGVLCCFGLVTGPLAIYFARQAKVKISLNPQLTGQNFADGAIIIGIFSLVQAVMIIIAQFSRAN